MLKRFSDLFRSKSKRKAGNQNITENDLRSRGVGGAAAADSPPFDEGKGWLASTHTREEIPCYGGNSSKLYGGMVSGIPDPNVMARELERLQEEVDHRRTRGCPRDGSFDSVSEFRMVTLEELAAVSDHVFNIRIERNADTGAIDLSLTIEAVGSANFSLFVIAELKRQFSGLQRGDVVLAVEGRLLLGHSIEEVQQQILGRRSSGFDMIVMKGATVPGYAERVAVLQQHFGSRSADSENDEEEENDEILPDEPPQLSGINNGGLYEEKIVLASAGTESFDSVKELRELPRLCEKDYALLHQTPVSWLPPHYVVKLGEYVDSGDTGDWKSLAGKCGLTQQEVRLIQNRRTDGKWTEAVLENLNEKSTVSLGQIYDAVKDRNRNDIIEDIFIKLIIPDLRKNQKKTASVCFTAPFLNEPQQSPAEKCTIVSPPSMKDRVENATLDQSPDVGDGTCCVCRGNHAPSHFIYISYARDAVEDAQSLARWITQNGYGAHFDQVDSVGIAHDTVPVWKLKQLQEAEFVVVLCTPAYKMQQSCPELDGCTRLHEPGCGVSMDMRYITNEVYQKNGYRRFAPVLVKNHRSSCIPDVLRNTMSYRFPQQGENLLRRIGGIPEFELPPIIVPVKPLLPKREW